MTNWGKLLKDAEFTEVSPTTNRNVVVDVPQSVINLVAKLKEPGPTGRKQRVDLPIPDGEDWSVLKATFKAAGDKLEPMVSVTVKPLYADGDEYKTTVDGKEKWVVKDGALPSWLRITVGPRRGGAGSRKGTAVAETDMDASTDESDE